MLDIRRWLATIGVLCVIAGAAPAVEGDWFVHTGAGGIWASNPKHPACKKLREREDKASAACLAFNAQDDWTLLDGVNQFFTSDPAMPLGPKLRELAKAGHTFRWLAFTPDGGWALLYDKNGFAADGIPADTRARLDAVAKADGTLRSIAFAPQGGWVIVTDDAILSDGVPTALDKTLRAHVDGRIAVRCVAFTSQGEWVVLNGRNEFLASDANHPACKKLQELRAAGEVLQWIAFAPGDFPAGYVLERTMARRVKAVLDFSVDAPDGGVAEWIAAAPRAPTLDRQRDVETTLAPAGKPALELSPLKRPLLVARLKDRPRGMKVTLTIEATLHSTRLRPRLREDAPFKADLDAESVRLYTRVSDMEDFKAKAFQDWLDRSKLRRGKEESDMVFARRVFQHLKHSLVYERRDGMDFRASAVCKSGKTDCSGMSHLFVAALRAGSVPARAVVGRMAESEKEGALGSQRHVRAEFFARGVGWVPVEMTSACADERRGEFAHFGNDPGDFIVMHVDTDLLVESYVVGRASFSNMQGFSWWRRGGTAKGDRVVEHWTVK